MLVWKKNSHRSHKERTQHDETTVPPQELSKNLSSNLELIKQLMGNPSDLLIREFKIASYDEVNAAVLTIKGMSERELINEQVLGALMRDSQFKTIENAKELFVRIQQHGIPNIYVGEETAVDNIVRQLISGNTILFLDQVNKALIIGSQGWKDRAIAEPITENVVRGPRDGFTETLDNNTALIRRRIKSPNLRIESIKIGTKTHTELLIVYVDGVAREEVVKEVRTRLSRIQVDGVLGSGYIEEFIEDNPYSLFPQIEHSERPDKVVGAILEGRVAILIDTTPFVLMVPTVFLQFIQSAEDYYERYPVGSFTRMVRIAAYFISVVLPALYIALTSYHQEMIPTPLALSIAASREGVPFPSIGEAFLMEGTFEILREAGLRLPRQTGQAVSIVGGLVIGQAAVQAGIVSQAMVIVVALTGISSFAIPAFNAAASGRLLRFPLMLIASALGLPGILAGLSIILIHLSGLRSFGVNYLDPFTAGVLRRLKDTIIRFPWWAMSRFPGGIARNNWRRVAPGMAPVPPDNSDQNTGEG